MKRAAIDIGGYFAGGLILFIASHFMPEHSSIRDWANFLGLIGMSFPVTILAGLSLALPHEFGHIWMGKRRGFQYFGMSLMGFSYIKYYGKNFWKWEMGHLFTGQRSMAKKDASIKDLRLLLIAGPIASFLTAVIWSPFLLFETTLPVGIIGVGANLLYGLASLIPSNEFRNGGSKNDGTYLLMSYRQPEQIQKVFDRYYERVCTWLRPTNYNLPEVKLTGKPNDDCYQNLFWYWKLMDGGKITEAGEYLMSALHIAQESGVAESYTIQAAYESAVHFRRFQPNAELVQIADDLCEKFEPDHEKKCLVEGAKEWVSGNKTRAVQIWSEYGQDYSAKFTDPGLQVHGRDWFIRLRTEEMLFETDRLFVRPWTMDDLDAAFDMYRRIEVMRYLGRDPKPIETIEEATAMMERWITNQAARPAGQGSWAIVRKDDEKIIGTIMCKALPNNEMEPSGELEIGWHLHPDAWGYGYATEAAKAVAEYGFRMDPNLERVLAVVYTENQPSQKVAKRVGMTHQGVTNDYYGMPLELFELPRN